MVFAVVVGIPPTLTSAAAKTATGPVAGATTTATVTIGAIAAATSVKIPSIPQRNRRTVRKLPQIFTANPSRSTLPTPMVFFNTIPNTGSATLIDQLIANAKRSRGKNRAEHHASKSCQNHCQDQKQTGSGSDHEPLLTVCNHLANLTRRPYPGVWAFQVAHFEAQAVCPDQWETPSASTNLDVHASKGRGLKYRELNAAGTGLQVWSDEVQWINLLAHPVTRWAAHQAYRHDCICTDVGNRAGRWCNKKVKDYGKYVDWYCSMNVVQIAEAAVGILENLPPGAPPHGERNTTLSLKSPDDCYYTNALLGDGACAALGYSKRRAYPPKPLTNTKKLSQAMLTIKTALAQNYAWIGIIEEPEASVRVLRHRLPGYFTDFKGGGWHAHEQSDIVPEFSDFLKAKLSAALPIDSFVYHLALTNLQAKDAEYKGFDVVLGIQERFDLLIDDE